MKQWDNLYFSMRDKGFLSQFELNSGTCPQCSFDAARGNSCENCGWKIDRNSLIPNHKDDLKLGEIALHVGQYGDLYLCQGRHRAVYSYMLNLDKVLVSIIVRHEKWLDFKEEIKHYMYSKGIEELVEPLTHVDLKMIPFVNKNDYYNRINNISKSDKGKILVIGANWGYYCHRFEDTGCECWAYEENESNIYFLEKLKRAENRQFIIEKDFDSIVSQNSNFDSILFFPDRCKSLLQSNNFTQTLKRIKTKSLYLLSEKEPKTNLVEDLLACLGDCSYKYFNLNL